MLAKTKNVALGALVLVVALFVWRYATAWSGADKKIADAEAKMRMAEAERDALQKKTDDLTKQQEAKDKEIQKAEAEIADKKTQIDELKRNLEVANQQLVVETADQEIADNYKKAFGLTDRNVKIISYKEPTASGRLFTNVFLAMPVDIAKLAVISKNNEAACKEEVGLREQISDLDNQVKDLTNQKLDLERQKTQAWSDGYQKAYQMYVDVNKLYVDLLHAPPKVNFAPRWMQLAGGLVAGAALCRL